MNEPQIKLGGLSTPIGIIFFGEHFNCQVFERFKLTWKGLKRNNTVLKIKKNGGFLSKQWHLFILFLLADLSIIFKKEIDVIFNNNLPHVAFLNNNIALMQNPVIQTATLLLGLIIRFIGVIFPIWFIAKTRGYHGAEHKTIASVEYKNDIKNAVSYSRIHTRCGTNLIPLYFVFVVITGLTFMPLPGTSIIASLVCLKKIPLLSKIAVKIGSYLQFLTTGEPNNKEMGIAVMGMKELLKAEGIVKTSYHPARLLCY